MRDREWGVDQNNIVEQQSNYWKLLTFTRSYSYRIQHNECSVPSERQKYNII